MTEEDLPASANAATAAAKPKPVSDGEDDPSNAANDGGEDGVPF
jgi:hypothetical protein